METSDFPRSQYAGYFEFIKSDDGNVTARVYPLPSGAPLTFDGKPEAAEEFIRAQMGKLKKGAE